MATSSQDFIRHFLEFGGKSVSQCFEDMLSEKINIVAGTRAKASDSQNHLRDFLTSEHSHDGTFPRILADSDFLGGSFARHTKIWPLDDIDIFTPLDGEGLTYVRSGQKLPYTVVGDGILGAEIPFVD